MPQIICIYNICGVLIMSNYQFEIKKFQFIFNDALLLHCLMRINNEGKIIEAIEIDDLF